MAYIDYISEFLNRGGVEGKRQTVGYIPARPGNFYGRPGQRPEAYTAIGASGVTVATGCDLGQTNAETMQGYGLSEDVVGLLRPYFGLKKADAIRKLASLPLEVSPFVAEKIDHAVHAGYLDKYVRPTYERFSCVKFDALPPQAQAVVFSCCFQKGCSGVRRGEFWAELWQHFIKQDWANASRMLLSDTSQYKIRRRIEGKLLEELR